MTSNKNITIIGSGVIGLTLGISLLKLNEYKIKILSNEIPQLNENESSSFTSSKAGAIWRSFASHNDLIQQLDDTNTFYECIRLMEEEPELKSIIQWRTTIEAYEHIQDRREPWFKHLVRNYKILLKEEDGLPKGTEWGFQYDTLVWDTKGYLDWCLKKYKQLGGELVQCELSTLNQAFDFVPETDVVINCAGIGALKLNNINDEELYVLRGQSYLLDAKHVTKAMFIYPHASMEQDGFYLVIPRNDKGDVIIGGRMDKNNFDTKFNETYGDRMLAGCIKYHPELNTKEFQIIRTEVGFRPCRLSKKIRLDILPLDISNRSVPVMSFYGHGGSGFQSSWGSCSRATEYLLNYLKGHPISSDHVSLFSQLKSSL